MQQTHLSEIIKVGLEPPQGYHHKGQESTINTTHQGYGARLGLELQCQSQGQAQG